MDKFLESLGYKYKYDELSKEERDTVHAWFESLQKAELTVDKIRNFITYMREAVELELTKPDNNPELDRHLKARLKNLLLLSGLLSSPEKAKQAIEREMGK